MVSLYNDRKGILNAVKIVYALTIAAFLIMTMAFGVSAFYEEPQPEYPADNPMMDMPYYGPPPEECEAYDEWLVTKEEYDAAMREWSEESTRLWDMHEQDVQDHHRNIFFIAYPIGLLFIVLGLEFQPRLDVLRPGLLLGGFGIIIFALSQSDLSDMVRFIGVFVGMIFLIYIGYRTLIERRHTGKDVG